MDRENLEKTQGGVCPKEITRLGDRKINPQAGLPAGQLTAIL